VGRFDGKVALVTGAAKGQGRSHAVRFADEGADVVLVDVAADLPAVPYAQGTLEQLAETAALVEKAGRRAVVAPVDVRDRDGLRTAVDGAVAELGRLDVVVANAGVLQLKAALDVTPDDWATVLGVTLTGAWNTVQLALPHLIATRGTAIVVSSAAGAKGVPHMSHYSAAKAGLLGLVRSLAVELGPQGVRVNAVLPTTVDTDMVRWSYPLFRPDLEEPVAADVEPAFTAMNALPVPWIEPADVTAAVCWLASAEARYVTGVMLPVDAGTLVR
jgi:SDR family mycofactocin-dependent oxidoreductase